MLICIGIDLMQGCSLIDEHKDLRTATEHFKVCTHEAYVLRIGIQNEISAANVHLYVARPNLHVFIQEK